MILHPEDAHSCKEQPHAKIRYYLPLIINKPSQYVTTELLKRTENISNLQNIYIEFAGYDMASQHFPSQEHRNISPTLPSPLLLYSATGLRQSEFPTATLHVWTRKVSESFKLPAFKEYASPCILHGCYKGLDFPSEKILV